MERNRHNDLKKTWELANAHFIAAQDQLKSEVEQLQQKLQSRGGGNGLEGKVQAKLVGLGETALGHKKSLSTEALDVTGTGAMGAQAK